MGALTNAEANRLLDHATGRAGYTAPTTVYLALTSTAPTAAAAGTELTGGAYARKAVTFSAAASRAITNSASVAFGAATIDHGTVAGYDVYDALTGGNRVAWDTQSPTKEYDTGDTYTVDAGDLDLTLTAA